jgi:hypothetical protein
MDPNRSKEDRDAFLGADIMSLPIDQQLKGRLMQLRKQVFNQSQADPQMGHALMVLGPMLESSGIKDDKAGLQQFRGALHDVIQDHIRDTGKKPNDDEIKVMGSRLVQSVPNPAGWFPWSKDNAFRIEPPEEFKKMYTSAYQKAHDSNPDDSQIRSAYTAWEYQRNFGKKR